MKSRRRTFMSVLIVLVLLFFASVPLAFMLYAALGAASLALIIIGVLTLLTYPLMKLLVPPASEQEKHALRDER